MYTLRVIKQNGVEANNLLGYEYSLTHLSKSPDEFKYIHKEAFNEEHSDDSKCYAIVVSGSGRYPLYVGDRNYIVTESGKTFSHLSY